MKKVLILLLCFTMIKKVTAQPDYSKYPVYHGTDLGLTYSKTASAFRIWSPQAVAAELILYKEGTGGEPIKTIELIKGLNGTWFKKLSGNLAGTFYTFRVKMADEWSNEVPDPYAKAVGVNGKRAMFIDLQQTDQPGWYT